MRDVLLPLFEVVGKGGRDGGRVARRDGRPEPLDAISVVVEVEQDDGWLRILPYRRKQRCVIFGNTQQLAVGSLCGGFV